VLGYTIEEQAKSDERVIESKACVKLETINARRVGRKMQMKY